MGVWPLSKGETVDEAKSSIQRAGNAIGELAENDVMVSLEVWFNNGSESMTLHNLSGEFDITIREFREL